MNAAIQSQNKLVLSRISHEASNSLSQILINSFKTLVLWNKRISERRQLAELDNHLLADMGISRYEARKEYTKVFWRA